MLEFDCVTQFEPTKDVKKGVSEAMVAADEGDGEVISAGEDESAGGGGTRVLRQARVMKRTTAMRT